MRTARQLGGVARTFPQQGRHTGIDQPAAHLVDCALRPQMLMTVSSRLCCQFRIERPIPSALSLASRLRLLLGTTIRIWSVLVGERREGQA